MHESVKFSTSRTFGQHQNKKKKSLGNNLNDKCYFVSVLYLTQLVDISALHVTLNDQKIDLMYFL